MKFFADSANIAQMRELSDRVAGFTTNPSLLRQNGIRDYEWFAQECTEAFPDKPISFEVIADDLDTIEKQARQIASWGKMVYVKIPISLTDGTSTLTLIGYLSNSGVKVNVTAVFTAHQVYEVTKVLEDTTTPSYVSVFAGRIADAGEDPMPIVRTAVVCAGRDTEIIWASTREIYNIKQAEKVRCDIITVSPELLAKSSSLGKDLDQFSRETVAMFFNDAQAAGLVLRS